jgi:uncharacterized protein YciI
MKKIKKLMLTAVAAAVLGSSAFSTTAYAVDSICSNPPSTLVTPIRTKQFLMVSFLKDPTTPYTTIAPLVKSEAQLAWDYYSTGRIQQMYGRLDQTGVVILWNANTRADAETAISQMPMVQAGYIGHILMQVKPFSLCSLFNTGTPGSGPQPTTAKPQQFVVITSPAKGVTATQLAAYSKDETAAIWTHYQTGIVRSMFDRIPNVQGSSALVITANDLTDATQIVEQLPMVQNHLVKYQLIPVGHFFPLSSLF